MRVKTYLMIVAIALLTSPYALAEGDEHHGDKGPMMEKMEPEASSAIAVANKVCPVSGEKVGGMGPAIKVEHNGKIYNLCCSGCIDKFKADPDKYIKIVDKEMVNI